MSQTEINTSEKLYPRSRAFDPPVEALLKQLWNDRFTATEATSVTPKRSVIRLDFDFDRISVETAGASTEYHPLDKTNILVAIARIEKYVQERDADRTAQNARWEECRQTIARRIEFIAMKEEWSAQDILDREG